MIESVIEYIRDRFQQELSFADLVGGLVIPLRKKIGKAEKVIPAWKQVARQQGCNTDDYIYLIPDKGRKSVIFFRLAGHTFTQFNDRYAEATATVNLVCWINYHATSMHTYTNVPYQVEIIRLMNSTPRSISFVYPASNDTVVVSGVLVELAGETLRNDVWSGYDLDEVRTQYGMYPYDYFGLKFVITYRFNAGCYLDIVKKETECYGYTPPPKIEE